MPKQPKRRDFDTEIANFAPRQIQAVKVLDSGIIKFLLYGGALGGGKSYFLRWYAARRLIWFYKTYGLKNVTAMLACEDYPSLEDRQLQKVSLEFPPWLGQLHAKHKVYGRAFVLGERWGGGAICFRNLDDPSKYASAEFALIEVDELTKNAYDVFTFLRTRLRWPGVPDIECQFVAGTNPGGVGHGWVKQLWMDRDFANEWVEPVDYRPQFAYVPSKADDNPYLDASYYAMLGTLDSNLRKAFRDGSWDIYLGQAFPEFSRQKHVIDPIDVPEYAQIYFTFDWGFGKPFSCGWWWVDADGRVYRFAEWYGWNETADHGLRLVDSDIAEGIKKREKDLGLLNRKIIRLCDPTCQDKKPDYKGGGQGESTINEFAKKGVYMLPGNPNRKLKIRQFHERLNVPKDENIRPMMLIYSNCAQFIRTVPNLSLDSKNIEDVDTNAEDHIYDEACHIAMARPIAKREPKVMPPVDKMLEDLYRMPKDTDFEAHALREYDEAMRDFGQDVFDDDTEPTGFIPTIQE